MTELITISFLFKLLQQNQFAIPFHYTMDYFTTISKQTSMEEEYRITKDKPLRILRLIKKAHVFIAELNINPNYINEFALTCAYKNKLGINKNRGFGTIKIELYDENNQNIVTNAIKYYEENLNG